MLRYLIAALMINTLPMYITPHVPSRYSALPLRAALRARQTRVIFEDLKKKTACIS